MNKMIESECLPLKVIGIGAIRDISAADGLDPLPTSHKYYMRLQWTVTGKDEEFEVALPKEVFQCITERRNNFDSESEMKHVIEHLQQHHASEGAIARGA